MRLSATPVEYRIPPPLLGEHTQQVLSETLGIDTAKIEKLSSDGII